MKSSSVLLIGILLLGYVHTRRFSCDFAMRLDACDSKSRRIGDFRATFTTWTCSSFVRQSHATFSVKIYKNVSYQYCLYSQSMEISLILRRNNNILLSPLFVCVLEKNEKDACNTVSKCGRACDFWRMRLKSLSVDVALVFNYLTHPVLFFKISTVKVMKSEFLNFWTVASIALYMYFKRCN